MALANGGIIWHSSLAESEPVDVWDLDLDDAAAMRSHGWSVAKAGGDKSECPVAPSHPQWSTWQLGWSKARQQTEGASGAMATRTALMKAEVRRQMEHLPEYGPDPAAEVATPRRRGLSNHGQHVHISLSANISPFLKAMQELAQSTAKAFTETMDAVNAVFDSTGKDWQGLLSQLQSEPVEPTIDLKRHGFAAFCPRHGQTRGGTCMKCARGRS